MKLHSSILTFIVAIVLCNPIYAQTSNTTRKALIVPKENTITINVRLDKKKFADSLILKLSFLPIEWVGRQEWKNEKLKTEDGIAKCSIQADEPNFLQLTQLFTNKTFTWFLTEPGDNVTISSDGDRLQFSGQGAEKYQLRYQIDSLIATVPKPRNLYDFTTVSLEDYFEWHHYLNRQLEVIIPWIDAYKSKLSSYAYNYLRANFIDQNIDDRSDKLGSLRAFARKNGISNTNLCQIYDSTYFPVTAKWFPIAAEYVYGSYRPIQFKILRQYGFDKTKDPLKSELKVKLLIFESALKIYKGLIREKFIVDFFPEEFIEDLGFIRETEKLLAEYYAEPDFPEYKKYMKEFELKTRERLNALNSPDFTLTSQNGQPFTKEHIKSKIAVFDFWFTGCAGCVAMVPALKNVEEHFRNDTNVVFISVSIDNNKEKWLKSIAQKKYTTGSGIQVYTGGEGENHDMIRQYAIDAYPTLYLMDYNGRFIHTYPKLNPRRDNGQGLIALLEQQLAYMKDGPYILHENNVATAYSFNGANLTIKKFDKTIPPQFEVQSDKDKTFSVTLRSLPVEEPCEFARPDKLLALSDIEGNFDAFKKLLQANNVIDKDYNWIFGNGHLVILGDMFDRGQQVTECLWLIYSLEEKSKKAGGYVHYILGNHEIMNLRGNHSYAQEKYSNNAKKTGNTLKDMYGINSELGRWLRTKNIMEKIGDLMFTHGGLGVEFTDSIKLEINDINKRCREYLDKPKNLIEADPPARLIFSDSYSPFWFRMYYNDQDKVMMSGADNTITWVIQHPSEEEMNRILNTWKISKVITGHTIIGGDAISAHYKGKVINTDTKHAEGKSEALLIEGNRFYRVNTIGEKIEMLSGPTP